MNSKMPPFICACIAISLISLTLMRSAHAFSVGARVKVKVLAPPCDLNKGNDIDVNFGKGILAGTINGKNHERTLSYTLDCPALVSNLLKMQFSGTGAAFDSTLLSTDKNNLAIELKNNGVKVPVNDWFNFTYPNQPVLTAVLVRNSTGGIRLGSFSATAMLTVEYQ
jgi:type 1 fimbria pilin